MRHLKRGRKLGRKRDQRKALLKNLATNLILKEKITTTEAKAKELTPFIAKLITKARKQDLSAIRHSARFLPAKAVEKLIKKIGPRFKNRAGGYTRIVKLKPRASDSAKMAIIEFVKSTASLDNSAVPEPGKKKKEIKEK